MSVERTLVVVNYHSAEMAQRAIETARAASALPLQAIVVDNSGDAAERARVERIGADLVIDAPDNPGYGEGANRGAAAADGDVLIVANPDVTFGPGSIDRLADALGNERVAMTGPRFSWDAGGRWLLPPPEFPTRAREIDRVLAGRSAAWRRWWRKRRREGRLEFWRLEGPAEVEALSGAVLCVRKEAFDRAAGFDPGFRLYFEEIDLMARLRDQGGKLLYLPAARCHHLFNQSAGRTASAPATYAESEIRFLSKRYGRRFARWAISNRRPLGSPGVFSTIAADRAIELPDGRWLAEASPLEEFTTAAGSFVDGPQLRFPPEILRDFRGRELFLLATELSTGRTGPAVRVEKAG